MAHFPTNRDDVGLKIFPHNELIKRGDPVYYHYQPADPMFGDRFTTKQDTSSGVSPRVQVKRHDFSPSQGSRKSDSLHPSSVSPLPSHVGTTESYTHQEHNERVERPSNFNAAIEDHLQHHKQLEKLNDFSLDVTPSPDSSLLHHQTINELIREPDLNDHSFESARDQPAHHEGHAHHDQHSMQHHIEHHIEKIYGTDRGDMVNEVQHVEHEYSNVPPSLETRHHVEPVAEEDGDGYETVGETHREVRRDSEITPQYDDMQHFMIRERGDEFARQEEDGTVKHQVEEYEQKHGGHEHHDEHSIQHHIEHHISKSKYDEEQHSVEPVFMQQQTTGGRGHVEPQVLQYQTGGHIHNDEHSTEHHIQHHTEKYGATDNQHKHQDQHTAENFMQKYGDQHKHQDQHTQEHHIQHHIEKYGTANEQHKHQDQHTAEHHVQHHIQKYGAANEQHKHHDQHSIEHHIEHHKVKYGDEGTKHVVQEYKVESHSEHRATSPNESFHQAVTLPNEQQVEYQDEHMVGEHHPEYNKVKQMVESHERKQHDEHSTKHHTEHHKAKQQQQQQQRVSSEYRPTSLEEPTLQLIHERHEVRLNIEVKQQQRSSHTDTSPTQIRRHVETSYVEPHRQEPQHHVENLHYEPQSNTVYMELKQNDASPISPSARRIESQYPQIDSPTKVKTDAIIAQLKSVGVDGGTVKTLKDLKEEKKLAQLRKEEEIKHEIERIKREYTAEKFMNTAPTHGGKSGFELPEWKRKQIAEKKAQEAVKVEETRLWKEFEDWKQSQSPGWVKELKRKS